MRTFKKICVLFIGLIILGACTKKNEGLENHPEFIGNWQCADTPLEHPDYYTGYLVWRIQEDGTFSMYDAEAGNPGIQGELQILSEQELQLVCNTEDDFDPPVTWENMKETQVIVYEFSTDKEMRVTFTSAEGDSTLVFTKED